MSDPSVGSGRSVADRREEHSTHLTVPLSPSRKEVERREGGPLKTVTTDKFGEGVKERISERPTV
jgi:hypothetical protein